MSLYDVFQEKTGGLAGIFKRSPKPAPRTIVTEVSRRLRSTPSSLGIFGVTFFFFLQDFYHRLIETDDCKISLVLAWLFS